MNEYEEMRNCHIIVNSAKNNWKRFEKGLKNAKFLYKECHKIMGGDACQSIVWTLEN